jgi:hypothetical protein
VVPAGPVGRGTPAARGILVGRAAPVVRVTRADLADLADLVDPGDRAMAATEVTAVTAVMAAMAVTVAMEATAATAVTAVMAAMVVPADLVDLGDPAGPAVPNPGLRVDPVSRVGRVVPADPESRAAMDLSPGQPVPGRTPALLALMPMHPHPMAALEPAHRRTLADRRWDPITRAVATCRAAARVAAICQAATRVAVAATQAVAAATRAAEVAAATRNRRLLNRFRRRGSGRSRCS